MGLPIYNLKFNFDRPSHCQFSNTCRVSKDGFKERTNCYNMDFPFILQYQGYMCQHGKFTALTTYFVSQMDETVLCNLPLIIFPRIVMVRGFFFPQYFKMSIFLIYHCIKTQRLAIHIISLFKEMLSFTKVARVLNTLWIEKLVILKNVSAL